MKKPAATSRLEQKVKRLSTLIDVNALISSTLNLDQILENVMAISKQVMNADASSLMLIDEKTNELVYQVALGKVGEKLKQEFRLKMGQGLAGTVAREGKPLLLEDAYTHPKFHRAHDDATGYRTRSMITVPLKVGERTTGVAQVINRLDNKPFDRDDLELFIALCSLAAIAIENAKMHKSLMEKQRLVKDLEFARTVQESFLPQEVPEVKNYQFSAHYTPAQEVGGDFYDFIQLGRDRMGIVIGDVSGKGVPAALFMAKLGSDLRTLAFIEKDPSTVLERLNDVLAERSRRGMFATLLYIELDSQTGKLTISNAGHLPPSIKKTDGTVMRLSTAGGSPIGILTGMKFGQETAMLDQGDTIVLYTDGIIEAMNAGEEQYGYERFEALIRKSPSDPEGLKSAIIEGVNRFTGLSPQHDDMTMVCFGGGEVKEGRGQRRDPRQEHSGAGLGRGMGDDKNYQTEMITLTVPSHPRYLYVIRSALYPVVVDAGFIKKEARKIVLAVDEACSNIIKYAYEGDHSKSIVLNVSVEKTKLVIELKDSGIKPDVSKIIPRKLEDIKPGGLGTHFMAEVFDTIEYDTSGDAGTTLTLEKRIHDKRGSV